jgi:hypothetical protein
MNRIRAASFARTFENESVDLLTRFTTNSTGARAIIIDDTIRQLKSAGVWTKLDAFYMLAAEASDQALLNWKSASFACTTNGTITFVADQGYTGNGTTGYLDTQFNPATAGGGFTQNSAHLGYYSRTSASSGSSNMGNDNALIIPHSSGTFSVRLNRSSAFTVATGLTTGAGYTGITRTGSATIDAIRNSTLYLAGAHATNGGPSSQNFWVGGRNGGTPQYGNYQIACAHFGSGLTSGELQAISGIVTSHLARIGAAV